MSQNMAQSGWHFHRQGSVPPTQFQVLGERACGTNMVRKLIDKAWRIDRTEGLGWKHAFPTMVAIPERLLVICVQRHVFSWSTSLYKRPWHADASMQALSFSEFIRHPWNGVVDRTSDFEMVHPEIEADGQPLQFDRHPITGEVFGNIYALRTAKSQALLGMRNRNCDVAYVQLEAVQRDAQAFIMALGAAFDLKETERGFRPITRRMGNRFRPTVRGREPAPEVWSAEDTAFALSQIDAETEAEWGYGETP
jgi:hypothetical protein